MLPKCLNSHHSLVFPRLFTIAHRLFISVHHLTSQIGKFEDDTLLLLFPDAW